MRSLSICYVGIVPVGSPANARRRFVASSLQEINASYTLASPIYWLTHLTHLTPEAESEGKYACWNCDGFANVKTLVGFRAAYMCVGMQRKTTVSA